MIRLIPSFQLGEAASRLLRAVEEHRRLLERKRLVGCSPTVLDRAAAEVWRCRVALARALRRGP